MKIVFMGTPEYSVKTIEGLKFAGHDIQAVFVQPDKPVGRKMVLTAPPVKEYAQKVGIPVYQPESLKTGEAFDILKKLNPDVIVVVAYGKMLPKEILQLPKFGCINGHASLLPKYRGASPIQRTIVCGEEVTGVTTILMDEGLDTGDILETKQIEIEFDDTAETLFKKLSYVTAELMESTLEKLEKGTITPKKQDEAQATYTPIIKKEMAHINFKEMTAKQVYNAARGYYPWPAAYFFLDKKRIKIVKITLGEATNAAPGTVCESGEKLKVCCADGVSVELLKIQPEGSGVMTAKQYLCGNKIPVGLEIIKEND